MADRYLYAGLALGLMTSSVGTFSTSTAGGVYNPDYAEHALWIDANSSYWVSSPFFDGDAAVTGETMEFRFHVYLTRWNGNNYDNFYLNDSAGDPWLRIYTNANGGGHVNLQYNSGTGALPTWTNLGSEMIVSEDELHSISLKLTLGSPHTVQLFLDDVLQLTDNFTAAGLTSIAEFELRQWTSNGSGSQTAYSEIIASVGINLLGAHAYYKNPTANGTLAEWTGSFADINSDNIDDTTFETATAADLTSTFVFPNLPTLAANQQVSNTFMLTRGRNNGVSPNNILPARRDSVGTVTTSAAIALDVGFSTSITDLGVIAEAEFDASEFGFRSAA